MPSPSVPSFLPPALVNAGVKALANAAARRRAPDPEQVDLAAGATRIAGAFRDRWYAAAAWHALHKRWETAESIIWLIAEAHPEEIAGWLMLSLLQTGSDKPGMASRVAQLWQRAARPLGLVAASATAETPPFDDEASMELRAVALGLSAWLSTASPMLSTLAADPIPLDEETLAKCDFCEKLAAARHPAWVAVMRYSMSHPEVDAFLGDLAAQSGAWPVATVFYRCGAHTGDSEDRRLAFNRLADHLERWRESLARANEPAEAETRQFVRTSLIEVNSERFASDRKQETRSRLISTLCEKVHANVRDEAAWLHLLGHRPKGMDAPLWEEPDDDAEWLRWCDWLADALAWALPSDPSLSPDDAQAFADWRQGVLRTGGAEAWSRVFDEIK